MLAPKQSLSSLAALAVVVMGVVVSVAVAGCSDKPDDQPQPLPQQSAVLAPESWTCATADYNDKVWCDCECGAVDPDCSDAGNSVRCATSDLARYSRTTCSAAAMCVCVPHCEGKQCGADGCGGSCGDCGAGACVDDQCIAPAEWTKDAVVTGQLGYVAFDLDDEGAAHVAYVDDSPIGNTDVFYIRREPGGWTAPLLVGLATNGYQSEDRAPTPDISVTGSAAGGHDVVVCFGRTHTPFGDLTGNADITCARGDGAEPWAVARLGPDPSHKPRLTRGEDGDPWLAFVHKIGGEGTSGVYVARHDGAWSDPAKVSDLYAFQAAIAVADDAPYLALLAADFADPEVDPFWGPNDGDVTVMDGTSGAVLDTLLVGEDWPISHGSVPAIVAAAGSLHLCLRNSVHPTEFPRGLLYAHRPVAGGEWTIEQIDAAADGGSEGACDLQLDSTGAPHVAYHAFSDGLYDGIFHARRAADGAWTVNVAGECNNCTQHPRLRLGPGDTPHVLYRDVDDAITLARP